VVRGNGAKEMILEFVQGKGRNFSSSIIPPQTGMMMGGKR